MQTASGAMADVGTKLNRAMSSNEVALQLPDSTSQQSRPGQPATPDQIQPCHDASRHSSAAALWPVDSQELSVSGLKPSRQCAEAFVTPTNKLKKLKASLKGRGTKAAKPRKRKLADTYTPQAEGDKRSKNASPALDNQRQAAPEKQPLTSLLAAVSQAPEAAAVSEGREHATALTEISQSAEEEAAQCCDSIASALAPLMRAHVRSKPGLPAEVTGDSEAHSNSASDKALQLSLAELKAMFAVPLTEAAARLGVHRQDLVRSCRRHNLEGWPRKYISVTEAARSDASVPTSAPSDADASELAAFVPCGPSALRSATLASQAHSVHTRSSSRVEGGRVRASGASTRRKIASPQEQASGQNSAVPGLSLPGPARHGTVAGSVAAETASLLGWATAKPASIRRQVPSIPLDRPGMWAPKILQARAQVQEATSAPRAPCVSAAAQPAPATEAAPAGLTAAGSAAALQPAAAEGDSTHASAAHRFLQALADIAPAQKGPCASAGPAAPHEQYARSTAALKDSAEQVLLRANSAVDTPAPQQEAAKTPQRQLGSARVLDSTPRQPATSPTRQESPTVGLASPYPTAPAETPVTEGRQKGRKARAQPAASAPLQGAPAPGRHRKKSPDASLGAQKALSAPLMLSAPESAQDEVTSPAAAEAAAKVPMQQLSTTTDLAGEAGRALQPDGFPSDMPEERSAAEQSPKADATAAAVTSCANTDLPAAEQLPTTDAQAIGLASALPAAPSTAEQGPNAVSPQADAKPRKRRGRPLGSSKAARAKALDLALPMAGTEGKRPVKKSRKALEAEQAEAALASLDPEELPALSGSGQEAGAGPEGRGGRGSAGAQPEQAPLQGHEGMPSKGLGMVPVMPQTPTSRRTQAHVGKCKYTGPDMAKIREDMECPETLPDDLPSTQCLDAFLNLSPQPTLPGMLFGGSICNSLLGSPLHCLDSPDYNAFYGEAFNDLSLANLNDIADSSFSFGGCFNT